MHTIELLEQAIQLAERLGYGVRQEWLGGCGGGACEVAGRRWMFIDASLNAVDQLEQLAAALAADPAMHAVEINEPLARLLGRRRAA